MNPNLRSIAARYASALKVSDVLSPGAAVETRPSVIDIWYWKLEEAVIPLVEHWSRHKQRPDDRRGYDSFHQYGHRGCVTTAEIVRSAPESVLFEVMGLSPGRWVWYQFMVRDLGWHSMIAANWGHPVLKIPDGVTLSTTTEDERRAQAVAFYLELARERGLDVLGELRGAVARVKARAERRSGRELSDDDMLAWLKRRNWCAGDVLAYGDRPNPRERLTPETEPAYKGKWRVEFAADIRAAAARRRANAEAAWSCDCAEREEAEAAEAAAAEDAAGWEREREGVAHALRGEELLRRAVDIGVCPDDELLPRLRRHLEEWTSAEYHIRNAYLQDRLAVFLARNEKARDLLRLLDHRELALKVKKEVRWLHIPMPASSGR